MTGTTADTGTPPADGTGPAAYARGTGQGLWPGLIRCMECDQPKVVELGSDPGSCADCGARIDLVHPVRLEHWLRDMADEINVVANYLRGRL